MKKLWIFKSAAPILLLSGCGFLFDGLHQTIAVDSSPSGVEIYRDGKLVGRTPLMLEVWRGGKPLMLIAKKEGYNDQTLIMESSMGKGGVFDVISAATSLVGTFGLTTDGTSGSLWEYQPGQFYANMIKQGDENKPVSKLKLFISRNYPALQNDAAAGDGEAVQALAEMSGMRKEDLCPIIKTTTHPSQLIAKMADIVPSEQIRYSIPESRPIEKKTDVAPVAPAAFETNRPKPQWVDLYERDGFIGQYDRMNRTFIGYGEGSSFKIARAEAYEDLLAKVQQYANNKAVLSELKLVSEYKSEEGSRVKVWLLYTYPRSRLPAFQ